MGYPTQRKGMRRELQTLKLFQDAGYCGVRSSGSHGPFDIVAWDGVAMYLVQVKANRWPGTQEVAEIKAAASMPGSRKLVVRWDDYQQQPKVRWIS